MEATSHVTRPGSLPHVRVVGFEPVPSMSAPEDARKPLFVGLLGGETIAVSSPLSQMLGGSNGKSRSADGSPQSGFFSAQSSDSDRSGDVARRFDNEHAAGELSRQASMEGTSDVQHDALAVAGRETPPIDIPYARGYRHPRSQRCANALFSCAFSRTVGFFARTARRDARLTSRFPRKAPSRASGTGPARRNARVSAVRARRRPAPARAREVGRHRVTRRVAEAPRRVRGRARTRSHAVFGSIPEVSRKPKYPGDG